MHDDPGAVGDTMTGRPGGARVTSRGRIGVLQFNCRSVPANLNKIKSRLAQQHPELVLIRETNLQPKKVVKIKRYTVANRLDRTMPRHSSERLRKRPHFDSPRGEGVLILVSGTYDNLSHEALPPITSPINNTTELVRIRLHLKHQGKAWR